MTRHTLINSTCSKCGCRAWEQSKPCAAAKRTRKPRQERESHEACLEAATTEAL